jgi:hypothetical protein
VPWCVPLLSDVATLSNPPRGHRSVFVRGIRPNSVQIKAFRNFAMAGYRPSGVATCQPTLDKILIFAKFVLRKCKAPVPTLSPHSQGAEHILGSFRRRAGAGTSIDSRRESKIRGSWRVTGRPSIPRPTQEGQHRARQSIQSWQARVLILLSRLNVVVMVHLGTRRPTKHIGRISVKNGTTGCNANRSRRRDRFDPLRKRATFTPSVSSVFS